MDSIVEGAVINPRPVKLCTMPNPSGMCMCSWMPPHEPEFRLSRWGRIYLSYATTENVLWWTHEEVQ